MPMDSCKGVQKGRRKLSFVLFVLPKSQHSSKQRTQSEAIRQKLHIGLDRKSQSGEILLWWVVPLSCPSVLWKWCETFWSDSNMWLLIPSVKTTSNITFNLASCFTGHVDAVPFSVSTIDALTTMVLDFQSPKQEFPLEKSHFVFLL